MSRPRGHRGNTASASAGHRAPTHAEAMVSTLSAPTPVAPTPDTPTPATRERPRRWPVIGVTVLLAATAALYLIDLTSSGDANSFYAAAVKSGTESVTAWIFGSLDAGNAITVDKPPGALWLMVLSARLFGFSSFSLLLPQALLGVGTVALTWATVRRWAGDAAGLVAGTVVMLTPVAALIFRFNNPDALLVFLMTLAAYAVVRAVDAGRGLAARSPHSALAWMVVAGAAIGFGFLTKMAEAFLVLPALGLVYLVVSPLRLRSRLLHLVAALVSMIISAGWFVALVAIWPAAARPYIGGSENNSLWELALGYNGLGRLLGGSGNGGGGGAGGGMGGANTGFGGEAGLLRMANSAFGGEISWFLPAALLGLVALLAITWRAPRGDTLRASALLWGGWLVVAAGVFSFMDGTIHPYYAVVLAPAIGGLVGTAGVTLWHRRRTLPARLALAIMIAGTAVWGSYLMGRDADGWLSWVRWGMLGAGVGGALLLALSTARLRKLAVAGVLIGAVGASAGAAAWTVATAASAHTGSIPTSGPAVAGSQGGGPGRAGGGPGGTRPAGQPGGGQASSTGTALVDLLNTTDTRWSAAVIGSQSAAGYILASDTAVMAIGGWGGSDDAPTLAQFQAYVKAGDISYFIASDGMGGGRGRRRPGRRLRLGGHPDHRLGRGHLHRHHRGRDHGLRPDVVVTVSPPHRPGPDQTRFA